MKRNRGDESSPASAFSGPLTRLPSEILGIIAVHLSRGSYHDLFSLSITCKTFRKVDHVSFYTKSQHDSKFIHACAIGDVKQVAYLLERNVDHTILRSDAIMKAIKHDHLEGVKALYNGIEIHSPPWWYANLGIRKACEFGRASIMKFFMDPRELHRVDDYNHGLYIACNAGHADVVEVLLEDSRVDPNHRGAFVEACCEGNDEVVKVLLADPRTDPTSEHAYYTKTVYKRKYMKVMKLLLADPRINPNGNLLQILIWAHSYDLS